MKIPFVDLQRQYRDLKPIIDANIQRVLDHGQFILGPEVKQLESVLAEFVGVRHCVTVASGTEALLIALMALGVGPGDEVITPAFTFIATAEVALLAGATPVMVDVDAKTCNLDVTRLEEAITSRTKAIIPVALYGQPADMDAINAIAAKHGIPVIEDAAQSFGAVYRGRRSCNLSLIGATSFFPSKPLGCYGDGGALFTEDDGIAKAMREIRVHGQERRYYHTRVGLGGRMDTIQCAIVLAKFEIFERELELRREVAHRYDVLFRPHGDRIGIVSVEADRQSAYAQYAILIAGRDSVASSLERSGIPTAVHYPIPIHRQPAYVATGVGRSFPVSDAAALRVLNLPMHPYLDGPTQERIVDEIVAALDHESRAMEATGAA